MHLRMLVILAALIACSSSSKTAETAAPPPMPSEVPPKTADPGAVEDQRPLQPSPPPEGEGSASQQATKADGSSCLVGTECTSGVCEGEGCSPGEPGRCVPRARSCTKDLRTYCGCDGKTFQSSGSCPGRRYATRNACGT